MNVLHSVRQNHFLMFYFIPCHGVLLVCCYPLIVFQKVVTGQDDQEEFGFPLFVSFLSVFCESSQLMKAMD